MQFLEAQAKQFPNLEGEIPIDVLIEIFSRVPAKSVAKLRCVSKSWRSILDRSYFKELFLTKSLTRPSLLLFSFIFKKKIYFFSSPLPENPDENMCLVPTRYPLQQKHYPGNSILELGSRLRGFICRKHVDLNGIDTIVVISNPVTGKSIYLPKVELKGSNIGTTTYLGYNPIDNQFKVLCINFNFDHTCDEHQVLTLENGNHLWRTTQCTAHVPQSNGICIDGILYYTARLHGWIKVVCFDVRSEKFSFIDLDEWMGRCTTLINYKGKLGALQFEYLSPKHLQFWVLEDAERCVWSKRMYTLPPSLLEKAYNYMDFDIVGMTGRGEVVFSKPYTVDICYIYYLNLESKRVTRVQIQGLEVFQNTRIFTSLEYEENLKLM